MQKKKLVKSSAESTVEIAGSELWAQYKLELLLLASKAFLNELFDENQTRSVKEIVDEFCKVIDLADREIDQHGSVVEILGNLRHQQQEKNK
jgi:hypothetical protein